MGLAFSFCYGSSLFNETDVQMFKPLLLLCGLAISMPVLAISATSQDIAGIRAAMDDRLKDSESAKIKSVRIASDGTTCGLVNAKNSYGAYGGYQPFLAMKLSSGKFYVVGVGRESGQVCESKGI